MEDDKSFYVKFKIDTETFGFDGMFVSEDFSRIQEWDGSDELKNAQERIPDDVKTVVKQGFSEVIKRPYRNGSATT